MKRRERREIASPGRRELLKGLIGSAFVVTTPYLVGRKVESRSTQPIKEKADLYTELQEEFGENLHTLFTEPSFQVPLSFETEKRADMAKQIFFSQKNVLVSICKSLIDSTSEKSFESLIYGQTGLIYFLSLNKGNLPIFLNDQGVSPHPPSAKFYLNDVEVTQENAKELGVNFDEISGRFLTIATQFPHTGNLGLYRINLSTNFYASAHTHAPILDLNLKLNDPVAFIHEIGHTLEGAYLHSAFLQYANEAEYYLYLSEKVKAMCDVLITWIDQCDAGVYGSLLKDGSALFEYNQVYNDGGKDLADYEAELEQLLNQPNHIKYIIKAENLVDEQGEKYFNDENRFAMLNVAWNFYLSDCFTGRETYSESSSILLSLLNELDHYFIGPVQKVGGGLPSTSSEVSSTQLGKSNIRAYSAFLRFFHADSTINPFTLGKSFNLDTF